MGHSSCKTSPMSISVDELNDVKKRLISTPPDNFFESVETGSLPSFDVLFKTLISIEGVDKVRILACDVISIWILRASKATKQAKQNGEVDNKQTREINQTVVVPEHQAKELFWYIAEFLGNRTGPFVNALKGLLNKLLDLVNIYENPSLVLQEWLDLVMSLSSSSATQYFLVDTIAKIIDTRLIFEKYPKYSKQCISMMWSDVLANQASKTFATLYKGIYEPKHERDWVLTWSPLVIEGLKQPILRPNILKYVLVHLFSVAPKSFPHFEIGETKNLSDEEIDVFIGVAKIGQNLALVESPMAGISQFMSLETFSSFLGHQNPRFRIRSFAFLVGSPKNSLPIPQFVYDELLNYNVIENFFKDSDDTDIRNEFLGIMRQFLFRIKDSSYSSNTQLKKLRKKPEDNEQKIREYELALKGNYDFLNHFLSFICECIKPGSKYPQLQLSFHFLDVLVASGLDKQVSNTLNLHNSKSMVKEVNSKTIYPFNITIYSELIIQLLINNVSNNYEDIREASVNILLSCPVEKLHEIVNQKDILLKSSIPILYELKGRKSEGGARIVQFIAQAVSRFDQTGIQNMCDVLLQHIEGAFEQPLTKDVLSPPTNDRVQGFFTALRLIFLTIDKDSLEDPFWPTFVSRVLNQYPRLWQNVRPILSNDKEDLNEDNDRIALTLSWKLVKESASFLQTILGLSYKSPQILKRDDFLIAVNIVIDQLSSVYHRGAFSSVYPTFVNCCEWCFKLSTDSELPVKWLESNISVIELKTQFISRRSGGLPFLITGILSASQGKTRKQLMNYAMVELLRVACSSYVYNADQKMDIPQVHAFNSIKHIFIDTNLANDCIIYVKDSLSLALLNCNSKTWAIRNCAVMLFTSLQNRLFGNKKLGEILPTVSATAFFVKYKGMKQVLQDGLEQAISKKGTTESIFPLLNILCRLEDTSVDESLLEDNFESSVYNLLSHKLWKVREMSARTLAAIIKPNRLDTYCVKLLRKCNESTSKLNRKQGNMLAVLEIVKRVKVNRLDVDLGSTKELLLQLTNLFFMNSSFSWSVSKVYVDILLEVQDSLESLEGVTKFLSNYLVLLLERNGRIEGSWQLLIESLCKFVFKQHLRLKEYQEFVDLASLCILSPAAYEAQLYAMKITQDHLKELENQVNLADLYDDLWTIVEGDTWSLVKAQSLCLLQICLSRGHKQLNKDQSLNSIKVFFNLTKSEFYSEDINSTALEALGALAIAFDVSDRKKFVSTVRAFANDDQPELVRMAAVRSGVAFINCSGEITMETGEMLLILYNALNDDDSGIRQVAEAFLSQYLKLEFVSTGEVISKRFVAELPQRMPRFPEVIVEEIIRNSNKAVLSLQQVRDVDANKDALFDIESTNLYKNDTEVHISLLQMLKGTNYSEGEIQRLDLCVGNYYETIKQFIKLSGNDGLIGWTRNELIFESISQLLLDIEFLQKLRDWLDRIVCLKQLSDTYNMHPYFKQSLVQLQQHLM